MSNVVLMNPLKMGNRENYSRQEILEVERNKKNITVLADHVAEMYVNYRKFEHDQMGSKAKDLIVCLLENFPETDVLFQKIVIPYTNRQYGKATDENLSKAIEDIQMFIEDKDMVIARAFTTRGGEQQVSLSLTFGFEREELENLGSREVLLPLINSLGRERTSLKSGGYLTVDLPAILKSKNHHNHPINLRTLNTLQRELVLHVNWDYVKVVKDNSDNQYERVNTFKSLKVIKDIYEETGINPALRFVWQYDSRGRMYPHAWGLNPNGRAYLKGMFSLPKRQLTEEGRLEVLRYVGTMAGYDKFTYEVREEKANILISNILKLYPELLTEDSLRRMECYNNIIFGQYKEKFAFVIDEEESEPYLLIGALEAYFDDQLGLPVGLLMRQDATSSGKLLPFSL